MLIWGIAIVIYNVVQGSLKRNIKLYCILISFLLIQIVSVLINRGNINISAILVNIILFLGVFNITNKKQAKDSIQKFSYAVVIMSIVFGLISIIFYFLNYTFTFKGVNYGRLSKLEFSGIYANPNTLGIVALFSIILSLILFSIRKNKVERIILVLNTVAQIFLLIISDCNSALLGLIVFILCIIFFLIKNNYIKIVYSLAIIAPSVFFINKSYHNYKLMDYLNGRYDLWQAAIKVIKENLLWGVGNGNLVEAVKHTTKATLWGIDGGGLHNIFLQIFTSNGIIAIIAFIIFMLLFVIKAFKIISRLGAHQRILAIKVFSFIMAIIIINCFEANMMYVVSFISITFWAMIGYFISLEDR